MPRRCLICLFAIAATVGAGTAAAAKPVRTLTLSPHPQYVTLNVRIAGRHWPLCAKSVRLTAKPRTLALIPLPAARLHPDGSFVRVWPTTRGLAGQIVRVTASAKCGSKPAVRSSALVRILPTP